MPVLLIAGTRPGAGKTALAAALALALSSQGQRVSLAKPVGAPQDPDAAFFHAILPTAPSVVPGSSGNPAQSWRVLLGPALSHDTALVEAPSQDPSHDTAKRIAEDLDARVVLVAGYRQGITSASIAGAAKAYGARLAGVLLNQVPTYRAQYAHRVLVPELAQAGVNVLGIVPEDRTLQAPTLRQVADHLGATFLTLEEQGRALVEHVMVAGWVLDEGQYVFGQRRRKIVVVRGDRPDMQMAALETDTVGLVLTGGKDPVQYTVYHAEARGVPLLATKLGTVDAMERLAGVQQRVTVHHPDKPNRFLALLDSSGALGSLAASTGMAIAQARAAGAA